MHNRSIKQTLLSFSLLMVASGVYLATSLLMSYSATASNRPESVMHNVPFTRQVPLGEWDDPRQKDGCEEASIIMALTWARGGNTIHPEEAKRDIINMSEYERVMFGFFEDTSIQDTAQLFRWFYNYENISVQENISIDTIKDTLAAGNLAIISLNTQLTRMPMYKRGPTRHTVVAVGYDDQKDEVIVHDPYYGNGKYVRIKSTALQRALWNYRSGNHLPSGPKNTAMISVSR